MLYCLTCRRVAEPGMNVCVHCGNGFVSALACGKCGRQVVQGASVCQNKACVSIVQDAEIVSVPTALAVSYPPARGPHTLRPLPSALATFSIPAAIPEVYRAGSLGADAQVKMGGRDAEILNRLGSAAVLLQALAVDMNGLQGHMGSTRSLIKAFRALAVDIQEEIETRLGPQQG